MQSHCKVNHQSKPISRQGKQDKYSIDNLPRLVRGCAFGLLCVCVCVRVCMHACVCPTLCNPMDCSLPDSSVCGILQSRIPEWVAICFSRGSS